MALEGKRLFVCCGCSGLDFGGDVDRGSSFDRSCCKSVAIGEARETRDLKRQETVCEAFLMKRVIEKGEFDDSDS